MPVFRVQANYTRGLTGKWSNVWHVNAADITTAATAFQTAAVPNLLKLLNNTAELASLLVSDEASFSFVTVPINAAGTSSATGDMLPLFNSVKALFADGSLGRPDYKYLKGLLTEGLQADGVIVAGSISTLQGFLQDTLDDMDAASAPLVSSDNDQYTSVSIQSAVQMRQMHRKRRKVVTP